MNPTLALFSGLIFFFLSDLAAACTAGSLGAGALLCLFAAQLLVMFLMFTPLHDGVHRSISKKRWINEGVLWGSWVVYMNSPFLFRKIHITHHANTNHAIDPDHFTSAKSLPGRWAKSFLLLLYYYFYALKHFARDGFKVQLQLLFAPFIIIGTGAVFWHFGRFPVFFWGWLAPMYVAIGFLAFLNTSWPHHPAQETVRIRNTRNLYVPKLLQVLMCNQNLHLVHHLNPTIPWYKYRQYWELNKDKVQAQGAQCTSFTKRARPY